LGLAASSDGFAAVIVVGFAIRTVRFIRALRIGLTATVECACSAIACGGMLRAINLFKSLRLGCRSESADGSRSTVVEIDESESLVCTLPSGSEAGAPPSAFSLRGLKLPTLLAPMELSRSTEDRLVCAEDVSVGNRLGAESDRSPLGGSVFLLCECNLACFPNGPRPREAKTSTLALVATIPMIKPTTANKNTSAATCNPDRSKI
jgi:hypothetical protein